MTNFSEQVEDLISTLVKFKELLPKVTQTAALVKETLARGNKVITCGNGGSAADALHLSEELVGRFLKERQSLAAISLCADPTVITCIANDYGFEYVFARQLEGVGNPGDLLIVFSTSGNSDNIRRVLEVASAGNIRSIALLGGDGGRAKKLADHAVIVPSGVTARIQEIHTLILHLWLYYIEDPIVSLKKNSV